MLFCLVLTPSTTEVYIQYRNCTCVLIFQKNGCSVKMYLASQQQPHSTKMSCCAEHTTASAGLHEKYDMAASSKVA
jgi:hypothetical protein